VAVAEAITGRPLSDAGPKQLAELGRLLEDHGPEVVQAAMRRVANGGRVSWQQLVYGARNDLEPIPSPRQTASSATDSSSNPTRFRAPTREEQAAEEALARDPDAYNREVSRRMQARMSATR
jgi:hypothetical protein